MCYKEREETDTKETDMKALKKITAFIGIIILGIGSFYLGSIYNSPKENNQQEVITQNLIAVVNADEGVYIDGKKVNYAADFMDFPNTNFASTGLMDARNGVENGRYAAYVILPNNFSQAVTSINTKPEKASVVYKVADNLRSDVKEDILQDIRDFTTGLSTNISYIYVTSIINEFHGAQDGAETVLKNDEKELKEINAIDSQLLISDFLFPEVKREKWEVETVNFAQHFEKLNGTVTQINNDYETYLANGKLAFYELDKDRNIVQTIVLNLTDTLGTIDIEYKYNADNTSVSENQVVYADGIAHLRQFEKDRTDSLTTTKNELGEIIIGDGTMTDLVDVSRSISENQIRLENKIKNIAAHQLDERDITVSWNDVGKGSVSQNDFWDDYMVVDKELFYSLMDDAQRYDATADMLKDVRESLFTKVSEIDTNPDRKVQSIITNEIVRPIEKNIDAETGRLQKGEKDAQKILWTYLGLLDNYDPLEFVDTEEINGELLKAENSMKEMEGVIEENNLTYYEFVSDVYDASDENYENLRKEVETHNETSASNIEMTIQQTKEKRSEKNQINTELLNDFAKKLPFTRLGTLENREVNEFIVSPINIEGTEYTQNRAILIKTDKGHLPVAAVAVAAVIILISNFLLIYTKERRSRHETGL